MKRLARLGLVAALLIAVIPSAFADSPTTTAVRSDSEVETLALHWFTQMQAGQLDRTQLTPAYSAQVTNDMVQDMSRALNEYGAAPTGAELLQSRREADQSLYLVKLVFPRGDAASFLFDFNADGKIAGIALMSMAGD